MWAKNEEKKCDNDVDDEDDNDDETHTRKAKTKKMTAKKQTQKKKDRKKKKIDSYSVGLCDNKKHGAFGVHFLYSLCTFSSANNS